jgi:hypothetical protein
MKRTFGPIAAAALLALSSGTAFAATYVSAPLPTEFGGGVVPADPKVLKNDQKASATIAKLAATVEKCYAKGVGNVSKGNPSGVDACLNTPAKGALPKFQAAIDKIQSKAPGLSACYDFKAAGHNVANTVKASNATVYCAGTTALDPEFGGGFVPPDSDTLKNVQKASKELAKLYASIEKCYNKGVGNFSKAKADGVDVCLNDAAKGVLPKFQAKIAGITLPPCADFATLRAQVEGISKAANSQYCACSKTVATVSTTYGGSASAVSTFLGYPDTQLDIPGFGSQQSVIDRVHDLTGVVGGTFSYGDTDTNANTLDDQLAVGLISLSQSVPSGPFATVTFDCKAGQAAAVAADFSCALDASDSQGSAVPGSCAVSTVSYVP